MLPRLAAVLFTLSLAACSSPLPNKNPVGEVFPTVTGTSLEQQAVQLPAGLGGKPTVLLVGYVQNAQFDLDRWILGLVQTGTPVQIFEVPTIPGLVPGMIAGTIDDGMRKGIPEEDWAAVITVYDDADPIVNFTGNTNPNNGRILLLDGDGVVRWFHDRGYSAGKVLELDKLARSMGTE